MSIEAEFRTALEQNFPQAVDTGRFSELPRWIGDVVARLDLWLEGFDVEWIDVALTYSSEDRPDWDEIASARFTILTSAAVAAVGVAFPSQSASSGRIELIQVAPRAAIERLDVERASGSHGRGWRIRASYKGLGGGLVIPSHENSALSDALVSKLFTPLRDDLLAARSR